MKRLLLLGTLATIPALAAPAREAAPADLYDGYTGFSLPAEPLLPKAEVHPSLWFRAADLPALRARLAADPFSRERWAAVLKLADLNAPLPAPPVATDKTEQIHKYYGALSMAARAHALAALLGDETTRAAHRARAVALLLRAYDGPIFELDSNVRGSAVDEIYRGSWLQNYAHAYDCVQPELSPDDDRAIRRRLAREAQCVHENLYRWTPTSPHNHLSKPAWGLGSMALTLSAEPAAAAWLGRALEASNRNTRYFFAGDGLYREGSHYLVFSLTNFLPFLYHYRNVSGVDGFTAFQPVFEAMIETRNSHGWLPNLEDSYLRPTPTHLAAAAYAHAPTALHPTAPLGEILAWGHATTDFRPFDEERRTSGFNYTGASWDYPLEIDELLTRDPALRATAPAAAPNRFRPSGQTVLRDGWRDHGPGQRYLLFHGVAVADNHNHDDQLSFILEAEGQLMASDAGYSRGTYAGAERTAWYNTAAAHNTLTFAGRAADARPSNVTPPTRFRVDLPGLAGEEKAATFGPAADWRRAIFWLENDWYVVIDRVDARQPGEIKAFLHGGRARLAADGARRTWTYDTDRYGPAAQLLSWTFAPGATTTEQNGELTYIKGDYAAFPYLETAAPQFTAPWLTVLKPAAAGATPDFAVEDRSTPGRTTLLVRTPAGETLVTAAAAKGAVTIGDLVTDGSLVIVRRDRRGDVINYCAPDATSLVVDGESLPLP